MAELIDRLPLTQGTNRVIDMPASPSILGAVAGFAADTLSGFMDLKREEAENRRRKKQEEDKKREQEAIYAAIRGHDEAVDLVNESARGFLRGQQALNTPVIDVTSEPDSSDILNTREIEPGVFSVETRDPNVDRSIQQAGSEIINITAAVEQGRMPPITLKAALGGKFNQLIDQYPDQAEKILDIWKKMGIDTALFREGRNLGDQLDEDRESRQRQEEDNREFEQQMFELGAKALGETLATGGENGGAMSREEVISHGLVVARQAHDMELELKGINIQTQRATLTKQQRDELEDDRNDTIFTRINNALYNGANPVITMVQNLANSILKEPNPAKQAEQWQAVGTRLHSMIGNEIEQAIQVALQGGYTGDVSTLRSTLTAQFKRVEDLFTGEFSVAQSHIKALQTIQTRLKIEGSQALPIYTTLKELGFDPQTMTGFMEGITENSELAKQLRDEIKGFNVDFGRDRASEHLMQVIRLLRGEATLGYMSPSEARARLPDLYNTTRKLAVNYGRGLGGNPDMIMNGLGELSIAANSLTPSSGANSHIIAVAGVLSPDSVKALRKLSTDGSVDESMVTATIQAARAAGAHVLNNFQTNLGKLNQNPHFSVVWDDKNGRYKIDNSKLKKAVKDAKGVQGRAGGYYDLVLKNAKPPQDMERWVKSANSSLDGLIALKDLDPTTPKGSDLELRNYYGRNITPASVRQEGAINVDSEINKQFEAIEQTIDRSLTGANRNVRLPVDYRSYPNYPKYAEAISAAASKHGVPEDVAVALLGLESGFDPTAKGPVINNRSSMHFGDRAMGMGQVMATTAREYGIEDRGSLSPEQQIELAVRYLSDLKKKGGDWKDAVSRYFSGRPYEQAVREGASDQFTSVIDYVDKVL